MTKPTEKEIKELAELFCDNPNGQDIEDTLRRFVDEKIIKFGDIKAIVDSMTDDERLELFGSYCKYCGRKDPRCQCWNDE